MKKILTTLRNKPERVREQIALAAAGGVTVLVVVIWGLSLGNSFRNTSKVVQDSNSDAVVQPEKPFTLFFKSLSSNVKEQRQKVRDNNPFTADELLVPDAEPVLPVDVIESDTLAPISPDAVVPEIIDVSNEAPLQDTTETEASKDQSVTETVVQ